MEDRRRSPEAVFNRIRFLEGEWEGRISSDPAFSEKLICHVESGVLSCISEIRMGGETVANRHFEIWLEGRCVRGRWEADELSSLYDCEYEPENDEFLFNLSEGGTSLDYRTIRRKDMMHFITMEQRPREGTSSVETLQVEYVRTL